MNKAEKSLRWVVNQIPDFKPTTNEEKMLVAIKLYSEAGAEEIKRLESENAALRERLEKAVELPLKAGSTVYIIHETDEEDKFNPWIDTGRIVTFSFDVELWIFVRYNSGLTMWYSKDTFDKEVCLTPEAAEARLAELKGETK